MSIWPAKFESFAKVCERGAPPQNPKKGATRPRASASARPGLRGRGCSELRIGQIVYFLGPPNQDSQESAAWL